MATDSVITAISVLFLISLLLLVSCSKNNSSNDLSFDQLNGSEQTNSNSNSQKIVSQRQYYEVMSDSEREQNIESNWDRNLDLTEGKSGIMELDGKKHSIFFQKIIDEETVTFYIDNEETVLELNAPTEFGDNEFILYSLKKNIVIPIERNKVKFYLSTWDGMITDTLEENQYRVYELNGAKYKVEVLEIVNTYGRFGVKFLIDEQETNFLGEDQKEKLSDLNLVYVGEIFVRKSKESTTRNIAKIALRSKETGE